MPKTKQHAIARELEHRSVSPEHAATLETVIELVNGLPSKLQEAIAETILANLREDANPSTRRFQELVEVKYTRGLKAAESLAMAQLEAGFHDSDEAFSSLIGSRRVPQEQKSERPPGGDDAAPAPLRPPPCRPGHQTPGPSRVSRGRPRGFP